MRQVDPLTLQLDGEVLSQHGEISNLSSVHVPEVGEVTVGKTTLFFGSRKDPYPINRLTIKEGRVLASIAPRTRTSFFLLPLLGGTRKDWLWGTNLLNAFCQDPQVGPCIMLLYRFSGSKEFAEFEKRLRDHPLYLGSKDPTGRSVLHLFRLPSPNRNEHLLFLEGKYSMFPDLVKKRVLFFHNQSIEDELGQILYRSPVRRRELEHRLGVSIPEDAELYSVPDLGQETFDPTIYRL